MSNKGIPGELDRDVLEAIGVSEKKTYTREEEERKDPIWIDMYDPNIPKHIASINQMSAKELCQIITTQFKQSFNDYRGCTFRQGPNGILEFIMVWQNYAQSGDKYKNIELFNQGNNKDDIASFVEATKRNKNGRKTMTLNEWTRRALKPFMLLPGQVKNGQLPKINWDDCLEEKEVNGQMMGYYPTSVSETILILKNINVESIIDNIWTPSKIKKADKMNSLIKYCSDHKIGYTVSKDGLDVVIDKDTLPKGLTVEKIEENLFIMKSIQNKLTFRGFKITDFFGSVNFHPYPLQVGPNGQLYQLPIYDLSNFFVNIETVDIKEAQKILPQTAVINNAGFLSTLY